MTLSGWTRVWIVGAVIWWVAGALVLVPQFPARNAAWEPLMDTCRSSASDSAADFCAMLLAGVDQRIEQIWWDLTPSIALWIAGPIVVCIAWVWIRQGFANRANSN